jgi:CheY-like chemotaxis protein
MERHSVVRAGHFLGHVENALGQWRAVDTGFYRLAGLYGSREEAERALVDLATLRLEMHRAVVSKWTHKESTMESKQQPCYEKCSKCGQAVPVGAHTPESKHITCRRCATVAAAPALVVAVEMSYPSKLPAHRVLLLVEDDSDVREAITEVLQSSGREVFLARDGAEALALLDRMPRPCLILLDLIMPHMDGFEFLSQLVERPDSGDFPVLVLSAHNQIAEAEEHPGVLGTLQKPFDVDELLRIVSEHC